MFEWPHGAPSSAVVSDFMEKLAQDGFSVRPTGAYCYFPMLRFHSASFYGCLGLTPVSMTNARL